MERVDMTETDVRNLTPGDLEALQERAAKNDAEACFTLSRYYSPKSAGKTRKYREKAAELDHPIALLMLASERLTSSNPRARESAFPLLLRAATLGRPEAMCNLANCYRVGLGCTPDIHTALEWYQKAADTEYPAAMFNMGLYYRDQFKKHSSPQDRETALKWLRKAAGKGMLEAQVELYSFFQDQGCSPEEEQEAFRWCMAAAGQGHLVAMYDLALFYRKGFGVEKDLSRMAHWFLMSAKGGQAHAQYNTGVAYLNGEGVERDVAAGISWLEKSAGQNDLSAIRALYSIFGSDSFGHKDMKKHRLWLTRAAKLGDPAARQRLSQI